MQRCGIAFCAIRRRIAEEKRKGRLTMKKRILAVLMTAILVTSMLSTPASAFYVGMVSYNSDLFTGEVTNMTLHVKREDGTTEKLAVFDENGYQHYIQVGPNEWEKLDPPLPPVRGARL